MGTIKLGIAGMRGLTYFPGAADMPGVEVTAFCELNPELLEAKANEFNIPNRFRAYEDMLNSDIDAVLVGTPMHMHATQSMQALDAGKHVLSEVIAATNVNELFWLKERAEQSDRVYMMCENYCYRPDAVLAKKLVEQGFFGDLYFAESEYIEDIKSWLTLPNGKPGWRAHWQVGKRGAFYPTHCLGPIMKCFGDDRIDEICCFGVGPHTAPQYRQEDTTTTIIRTKQGRLIQLRIDVMSNRPNQNFYFVLQGTKGAIESPRGPLGQQSMYRAYTSDGSTRISRGILWDDFWSHSHLLPENYRNMPPAAQKLAANGDYNSCGGDYYVIQDFIRAVRGEIASPVNVYEACEWSAVALLSELSAENNGRPIKMPDFRGGRESMDVHIGNNA
jgi:predicted dehydrogenase